MCVCVCVFVPLLFLFLVLFPFFLAAGPCRSHDGVCAAAAAKEDCCHCRCSLHGSPWHPPCAIISTQKKTKMVAGGQETQTTSPNTHRDMYSTHSTHSPTASPISPCRVCSCRSAITRGNSQICIATGTRPKPSQDTGAQTTQWRAW